MLPPPSPPPDERKKPNRRQVVHCSRSGTPPPPSPGSLLLLLFRGSLRVTRQRRCVFLARAVRHATHVCHSWGGMFDTMLAEGRDMWTGLVAQHVLALSLPTPLPSATVFSRCSCAPSRPSRGASSVGVVWVCMCVNRHVSMRGFAFSFCTFFSSSSTPLHNSTPMSNLPALYSHLRYHETRAANYSQ